jgi:hypothetical protein
MGGGSPGIGDLAMESAMIQWQARSEIRMYVLRRLSGAKKKKKNHEPAWKLLSWSLLKWKKARFHS